MSIRVAIVGCGAIADYLHAPAINLSKNCVVGALVDSSESQARNLADKLGVSVIGTSLEQVRDKVDAVLLATPPHVRAGLVDEATSLGLHVMCEKPLANTAAQCEQICAAGEGSGLVIAVCHQYRFWPARTKVGELIAASTEPPQRVFVSQGGSYSWNSKTGYTVRPELVSGGVLINAGIHPMDSLIAWFGDPTNFEYFDDSCGGLESNVRMQMEFGAVHGEFRMSRTCRLNNELRVEWNDGSFLSVNTYQPFEYRKGVGEQVETVVCGESEHGFLQPAADMYDDFASAIENGGSVRVSRQRGHSGRSMDRRLLRNQEATFVTRVSAAARDDLVT